MVRHSPNIHERFIKHIWSKQYLGTGLCTTDRRKVEVLDTGRLNSGSGPDFIDAKIRLGGIAYTGDVEIHRNVFDWVRHRHQEDPHYNRVILHVVLEDEDGSQPTLVQCGRSIPVLILARFLPESIHSIWRKTVLDERAMRSEKIFCSGKNDTLESAEMEKWLARLAIERMELKLRRFEERIRQLVYEELMTVHEKQRAYGEPPLEGDYSEIPPPLPDLRQKDFSRREFWEQILYEGVVEGLGYSRNRDPFLKIARNLTLKKIRELKIPASGDEMDALFFGLSGLLPNIGTLKEEDSRIYAGKLIRKWKDLKQSVNCEKLHISEWQFFPTRPSNFPTPRLAAASGIAKKFLTDDVFRHVVQILKSESAISEKTRSLSGLFTVGALDFWSNHYNFSDKSGKKRSVLGERRIHEILINAVLPVAFLYARIFRDRPVRNGALEIYNSLSAFEDNSITKLMAEQLLKGRVMIDTVDRQQAVIQLYKYYCSEGRCAECEFGRKLKRE